MRKLNVKVNRLNHLRICAECGNEFKGFKKQNTCWRCIKYYIKYHKINALNKYVNEKLRK